MRTIRGHLHVLALGPAAYQRGLNRPRIRHASSCDLRHSVDGSMLPSPLALFTCLSALASRPASSSRSHRKLCMRRSTIAFMPISEQLRTLPLARMAAGQISLICAAPRPALDETQRSRRRRQSESASSYTIVT